MNIPYLSLRKWGEGRPLQSVGFFSFKYFKWSQMKTLKIYLTLCSRGQQMAPRKPSRQNESLPRIACIRVIVGLMDSKALWF